MIPLWLVDYPPIQDLPQHLAAIRVLHSFRDPAFGFASYFTIDILRTQYLLYYLAAHALAYLFDLVLANKILLTVVISATPYAMRSLLRALAGDQRLALFVLPLTYNAHLILGFFNFLAAVPLALYGLSLAVQQRGRPGRLKAATWAMLTLVTFYTHVVPFGLLIFGSFLVFLGVDLKGTIKRFALFIPAALGVLFWIVTSPAGHSFRTAALLSDSRSGPQPFFQPWREALRDAPAWMTDILWDQFDDRLLLAWGALAAAALLCGLGIPRIGSARTYLRGLLEHPKYRLSLLAPVAALAYFVSPTSYDWIWPIAQRFPLLAAIFFIPALPRPKWIFGYFIYLAVSVIALAQFYQVGTAFRYYQQQEVGDFEGALEAIPERERVAGLIWQRGSAVVKFSPFIHYVAYYLVRKGGAVMFTFADFPASPYTFLEQNRPERVPPRWEWKPEAVDPARDLSWYRYVLVRGGPGPIASQREVYAPVYRGHKWSVWKRSK
ncbi:MAG: hypothetical protein JXA30_05700 [Deltaproteobacteria bacterium]|nr:hypothetical protein [Deltaproteobacteria bacterium]